MCYIEVLTCSMCVPSGAVVIGEMRAAHTVTTLRLSIKNMEFSKEEDRW